MPLQDATRQAGLKHHHIARLTQLSLSVDDAQTQLKVWGAGLNTFNRQSEDYRSAFEPDSMVPMQVAPGAADSLKLHITLCKTEDELASEISTSFEAGAAYSGVEVKGSASFLYDSKFTTTSSVVLVQASVCKIKQVLEPARLRMTDAASALMTSDPVEFVRLYGNYFHMGRLRGGQLTVVMHFSSTDLATKASFDAALNATVSGAGDIGAKIKASMGKRDAKTALDVTIYHVGGGPPPADAATDADALIKYATGFESSVDEEHSMPFQVLYDDYGSIGDAGPAFREAMTSAEIRLDHLADALQDYRSPLSDATYALDSRAVIGFSEAEIATLTGLQSGIGRDVEALQDYLMESSRFTDLADPSALVKAGTIRRLPDDYAADMAAIDLSPRRRGINLGDTVWLHLKSEGKFISASEYGPPVSGIYYGKLGANPIKLRLTMSAGDRNKLRHGDQVTIETTETLDAGYSKGMRELGGAYGDYVGWVHEQQAPPVCRFTIRKCHPTPDPEIQYGDAVWIESEDGRQHLEHSGGSYPDYLGLRNIVGVPGQHWTIEKPGP